MDPISRVVSAGAAGEGAAAGVYVEDVFGTYVYQGNDTTQSIATGVDLAGEGGMVWIKARNLTHDHIVFDTARGTSKSLHTNTNDAEYTASAGNEGLDSFDSDGFTTRLFQDGSGINNSAANNCAWTFRKAPGFFDVVTYTGNGTNQYISHNLGSVPGCIIVKSLNASDWVVYHRSSSASPGSNALQLNSDDAVFGGSDNPWADTLPTSTTFRVANTYTGNPGRHVNINNVQYVAYLFAHDEAIFGDNSDQSVIKCGSYTGNGSSTGPIVNLGWEPQWVMIKRTDTAGNWWAVLDAIRGFNVTEGETLIANLNNIEQSLNGVRATETGFQPIVPFTYVNASGGTYVYVAIRRGPMKKPTDATKVFSVSELILGSGGSVPTGFPVDLIIHKSTGIGAPYWNDRMRGGFSMLQTNNANNENTNQYIFFDYNTSVSQSWYNATNASYFSFRRAPGFFDLVAHKGTSTGKSDWPHALGVAPELIIRKSRDNTYNWQVWTTYYSGNGVLNSNSSWSTGSGLWKYNGLNTNMTATTFSTAASAEINSSSDDFITYLFATCPGVSKVGSYSGTGSTINVDCGFSAGARFVLIKRVDNAANWYLWDAARGIVAGNDPWFRLNTAEAENTTTDYIDPYSSGFTIATSIADLNTSGGTYIFLAIA